MNQWKVVLLFIMMLIGPLILMACSEINASHDQRHEQPQKSEQTNVIESESTLGDGLI